MEIMTFAQRPKDRVSNAWKRLQDLLALGPNLGIPGHVLSQTFYIALSRSSVEHVNTSVGVYFLTKVRPNAGRS